MKLSEDRKRQIEEEEKYRYEVKKKLSINKVAKINKNKIAASLLAIFLGIFLFLGFKSAPQSHLTIKELITPIDKVEKNSASTMTPNSISHKVIRVVDGDTIEVDIEGKNERIRLIGIDTPETVDPRKSVQCFGIEAFNKVKELLSNKKVILESDLTQGERDKYNRLLRYVFLNSGINFNRLMISEGFAHEYTYAIPYKYQEEFKQAEKEARENKKGLWADNTCITPTTIPLSSTNNSDSNNNSSFVCNCSKLCSQMSSCEEAYF